VLLQCYCSGIALFLQWYWKEERPREWRGSQGACEACACDPHATPPVFVLLCVIETENEEIRVLESDFGEDGGSAQCKLKRHHISHNITYLAENGRVRQRLAGHRDTVVPLLYSPPIPVAEQLGRDTIPGTKRCKR
jgi:hypothetical protein